METRSPSCRLSAADNGVSVLLTPWALSLDEAVRAVAGPDRGGLVLFTGTVRDTEDGAPVAAIIYEAYERMAAREMEKIAREAGARWDVRLAVRHRVGKVWAGEPAFIVAAAGRHRAEAFAACRAVVDRVKNDVPLWKTGFERPS